MAGTSPALTTLGTGEEARKLPCPASLSAREQTARPPRRAGKEQEGESRQPRAGRGARSLESASAAGEKIAVWRSDAEIVCLRGILDVEVGDRRKDRRSQSEGDAEAVKLMRSRGIGKHKVVVAGGGRKSVRRGVAEAIVLEASLVLMNSEPPVTL